MNNNGTEQPKVRLKKLTLTNFKNFEKTELVLGPVTMLIGANATGKSNLREAFRFLQGIGRDYDVNSILNGKFNSNTENEWEGIRGGYSEIVFQNMSDFGIGAQLHCSYMEHELDVVYSIAMETSYINGQPFELSKETLHWLNCPKEFQDYSDDWFDYLFEVMGTFSTFKPSLPMLGQGKNIVDISDDDTDKLGLTIQTIVNEILTYFKKMHFPHFQPEIMRYPSYPSAQMLADGRNLSSVLKRIYESSYGKEVLLSWLQELTPNDVQDLDFFENDVQQIRVQLIESGKKISAFSASDGTLRFLGMLALLLEPNGTSLYFFDEFEAGIHPTRLHILLGLIEQKAKRGELQVVITTHSPQLMDFVSRSTLDHSSVLYRLEDSNSSKIKRIQDIPRAYELIEAQGFANLHASGWFETALFMTDDDAEQEKEISA